MSEQKMQAAGWLRPIIHFGLITAGTVAIRVQAATNPVAAAAYESSDAPPIGGVSTALPPVIVRATRLALDPFEQPYALFRHDRTTLDQGVGRTALDRIDGSPGVLIQHTGPGQASPYVRGLTGRQSLLLLDGVRLSHAAMRSGPNQYAALIPDMSLDGIDAVLGSSSVINGSDGLTGALDFRLAPPGRGVGTAASPWVNTRIDRANGHQTAAGVDGAAADWRYSFEGSIFDFHDRIGGKDTARNLFGARRSGDKIPNTAYDQSAVAGRAAYDGFTDRAVALAFGHTRQDEAPRPDGYFENSGKSDRISRYYDPESFTYLHLRDTWTPPGLFFDELATAVWWHRQAEDQVREDLADGGRYRRREYDDRIDSVGIEPQATTRFLRHELTYGGFALLERADSAYREYRSPAGAAAAGARPYKPGGWRDNTTLTDGAEYNTFALYAQDLWSLNERWSLLSGLRYTYVDWSFDVAESDTDDVTGGMRASYRLSETQTAFAGVSKAFRAPNLSDLDGATDRGSSGTVAFGNPDLDPEVSYTGEVGWRFGSGRDQLGVSLFYTHIDDVIQRVYPRDGGNGTTANGERAILRGAELLWDYGLPLPDGFGHRLAVIGSVSLVDSEARVPQPDGSMLEEPISRANRLHGLAGLRYEVNRNWWTKIQCRFHDAYDADDIASDDADDVRLTIPGYADGTVPGFGVLDLAGGWINDAENRWVSLTFENLANKTYRQLGSGADAPGLNVVLAGGMRF